jgi:hypothetical protein
VKRIIVVCSCIILSGIIWLNSLYYFFRINPSDYFSQGGMAPQAEKMLNYHLAIWKDPVLRQQHAVKEHKNNPEWDFMWRTFLVLSMTNISLRQPDRQAELLPVMDAIIEDTVNKIEKNGMYYFLMDYAKSSLWAMSPPASLFHDGEIALMVQCRRLIKDDQPLAMLGQKYLDRAVSNMQRCPLLSAESYPNECWLFCNTVSLMAMRLADHLDGTDHSRFIQDWLAAAKKHLIDDKTGLLISAYSINGYPIHGPEGSSIWMAVHCLHFVDPGFSKQQFALAKKTLFVKFLRFGFSREWPLSWKAQLDCDAGGIFALLQASPSASVFALLAARTFNDVEIAESVLASLQYGGLPSVKSGQMKFSSSNLVGDAAILYALVQGAIEEKVLSYGN